MNVVGSYLGFSFMVFISSAVVNVWLANNYCWWIATGEEKAFRGLCVTVTIF